MSSHEHPTKGYLSNISLFFKDDLSPLAKIAVPLILTGFVQASVSFVNNIFLARLGENALAAGALVMGLYTTFFVVIFGLYSAINVLISYEFGAKNFPVISQILRDGLILTFIIAVPASLLFWYAPHFFKLITKNSEVIELATIYSQRVVWGLFFELLGCLIVEFLVGIGQQYLILFTSLLAVPLYIVFSYVLIFGKFGFPELGIAGAGWGRSAANMIATSLLCLFLLSHKTFNYYLFPMFNLKPLMHLYEILRVGIPLAIMYFMEICFYYVMTIMMGLISIKSLAANQITMQYVEPCIAAALAIGQSITVRIALQLGAKELHSVKRVAYTGMVFGFAFMWVIALVYWFFPSLLISVYFSLSDPKNADIIHLAIVFLYLGAIFQIVESIRIALYATLRALKDTQFCLLTSIICFWLISIPVGFLFAFPLQMGGNGFWWAMIIGGCINVLLLFYRFKFKINRLKLEHH